MKIHNLFFKTMMMQKKLKNQKIILKKPKNQLKCNNISIHQNFYFKHIKTILF